MAVAVFDTPDIVGNTVFTDTPKGVDVKATFSKLPKGKHGFHIHNAGDLRGEGCLGACTHFHVGPPANHGPRPHPTKHIERHVGDLGNIELKTSQANYHYVLKGIKVEDLWGRSLIVHEDEDDLGLGEEEDSKITGHSGKRIGCAIIGRAKMCEVKKTRKIKKSSK